MQRIHDPETHLLAEGGAPAATPRSVSRQGSVSRQDDTTGGGGDSQTTGRVYAQLNESRREKTKTEKKITTMEKKNAALTAKNEAQEKARLSQIEITQAALNDQKEQTRQQLLELEFKKDQELELKLAQGGEPTQVMIPPPQPRPPTRTRRLPRAHPASHAHTPPPSFPVLAPCLR